MLETPSDIKDANMHNSTVWYADDGSPYLAFPGNGAGKVFTTTLEGNLIDTLGPPSPETEFTNPTVKEYFEDGEEFIPTDVAHLDGTYYIATGYSDLDFVLTAAITGTNPKAQWSPLAFAGRGTDPGQLGTGHGLTIAPGGDRIDVADRPHSEIDHFSPNGDYVGTVKLPEGSYPCDIDYAHDLAVVGCLHGPDRDKGAPIYLLKDDKIISTIMPKEELGLENFQHIHNAVLVEANGTLHIIAQSWNPGDFAILRQVSK